MNTIEALLGSLQADAPVRRVLVGAFWTVVVLDTDRAIVGGSMRLSEFAEVPGRKVAGMQVVGDDPRINVQDAFEMVVDGHR